MIKRYILILFLTIPATVHPAPYTDIRTHGIANLGIVLALGGTYQLCKGSSSFSGKIGNIMSGLALISAGVAAILLSDQIVREADVKFR